MNEKELVGVDLLTGKEIYKEDEKHDLCPRCKKKSFAGHWYHQAGKCLSCGYYHPGDD